MTKDKAISLFNKQLYQINELKKSHRSSPAFNKWDRDTQIIIEKIFGKNNRHIEDFNNISYSPWVISPNTHESAFQEAYLAGLNNAEAIINSFIREIEEFGIEESGEENNTSGNKINLTCNRFHSVARQLRLRHQNRSTIEIEDEYDVQDLLHALLKIFFDDIRSEEWSPSYAGGSSRMDFLLKNEQIVVEVKKTRKGLTDKEIGEQLIIDIEKYKSHPDCKTLVCFVYDPEGMIANPKGLERDLSKKTDLIVNVFIEP